MIADYSNLSGFKNRFLVCATIFSLTGILVSWFFYRLDLTAGLFVGFLVGFADKLIMFAGIRRAMNYEAKEAFIVMKKAMLVRAAVVLISTLLAIECGINIPALFIAFFLIHMVCLVSIIINAKGGTPGCRKE